MNRNTRRIAAVTVLLTAGIALAALSPLLISAAVTSGILSVSTNELPKGWFSSKNALDRNKTILATTYSLAATSCSSAKSGGSITSQSQGNFTPAVNSQGAVNGYYWDTTVDLSASANRWYNHTHCDGTVEVHGCADAIDVTVTTTATAQHGGCHSYLNDLGQTVCASDTRVASLGSVQDPDEVDTACSNDSCGIGSCVSACEQACNALPNQGGEKAACKQACTCGCKAQLPVSCPPHRECD